MEPPKAQTYFEEVTVNDENQLKLIGSVLEKRLPASCFMYNQFQAYLKLKEDLTMFTFQSGREDSGSEEDENRLWILFRHMREDWGACISVSPPTSSFERPIPASVATALLADNYMNWSDPFIFVCVDLHVSDLIIQHNLRKLGNIIKVFPTHLFHMSPEYALQLDTTPPSPGVKVSALDPTAGAEFLLKFWAYTKPGTEEYLHRILQNYVSGGIMVTSTEDDSSEVCAAALVPPYGLLSNLVTHPQHRRKGYGKLVCRYIFKEMARQGYHPCLDAEIQDLAAVAFHKSVAGNTILSRVDYISHKAL